MNSSVLAKYPEILKQIVPGVSRVAAIYNPDNAIGAIYARLFETFARSLAIQTIIAPVRSVADFDRAIKSLAQQQQNGGAFFLPDLTTTAFPRPDHRHCRAHTACLRSIRTVS